jgi:hypothetical protein
MGDWLQRKRTERLERKAARALSKLPPMEMTPQARLLGTYFQVRNTLSDGGDPTEVEADRPSSSDQEHVSALGFFRAGLRVQYQTDDELAAFDRFTQGLQDQSKAFGTDDETLARHEAEFKMVRDFLAQHTRPPMPPPPT